MKDLSKNKYIPAGWTVEQCAFESRKAMTDSMSDPRYGKDAEYTELVGYMSNQPFGEDRHAPQGMTTGRQLSRAMADVPALQRANQQAIAEEHTRNLFMKKNENGELLYEKSPIYREQVRQYLIDNTPVIDAEMGHRLRDVNVSRNSYRVQLGTDGDTTEGIRQANRQAKIEKAQAAAAERKAEVDKDLAGQIDEWNATARPDHDEFSPI